MTSFIEIPHLAEGDALASIYVNVADIISLQRVSASGDTLLELRDYGPEGVAVTRHTSYLPIGMFLDTLKDAVRWNGVYSWNDDTKRAYGEPALERARRTANGEQEDKTSEPPCR